MQSNEINEILPTSKALHISLDDNPNLAVYKKMEKIIERMQKVRSPAFPGLAWTRLFEKKITLFFPTTTIALPRQGTWLTRPDPRPQIERSTLNWVPD